jgi:hypothetical protein
MIRFNYDNGSTDDDVDLYVVNTSTFRIENKFGDGRIEFVVSTSSIAISVEAIGASGYPTLELLDDTRLQIGTDNDGYIYFDGTNHIAVLLLPEATTAPGGLASKGLWIDTDDDRTIKSKA